MNNKILKAVTVMVFVTLIIGFVSYKSGYFDREFSSKPIETNQSDPIHEDTVLQDTIKTVSVDSIWMDETMMSSSKSMQVLTEEDLKLSKPDTLDSD